MVRDGLRGLHAGHLPVHADRLVGKDELLAAVWPDTIVTEDSLVQCLKEIRHALGERRKGPVVVRAGNYVAQVGLEPSDPLLANYLGALAQRHSFVTFDARGCGLSQREVGEVSFEAWMADLGAVIDQLGAPRVVLFGHSQGAAIAVAYAARQPQRVERLVLHGGHTKHRFCNHDSAVQAQACRSRWAPNWLG